MLRQTLSITPPSMPLSSANQSLVDPTSCLLYPANITEPVISCGVHTGVQCLEVYLVVVRGQTRLNLTWPEARPARSPSTAPRADRRPRVCYSVGVLADPAVGHEAGHPRHHIQYGGVRSSCCLRWWACMRVRSPPVVAPPPQCGGRLIVKSYDSY